MDKMFKMNILLNEKLTWFLSSIWCHIPLNDCDIWTYHQHACLSIQLLFMGDVCIWMWGKIWESIFVYDTSKFWKDISIVKILEHLVLISITLVKLKWEGKSRVIIKHAGIRNKSNYTSSNVLWAILNIHFCSVLNVLVYITRKIKVDLKHAIR